MNPAHCESLWRVSRDELGKLSEEGGHERVQDAQLHLNVSGQGRWGREAL